MTKEELLKEAQFEAGQARIEHHKEAIKSYIKDQYIIKRDLERIEKLIQEQLQAYEEGK